MSLSSPKPPSLSTRYEKICAVNAGVTVSLAMLGVTNGGAAAGGGLYNAGTLIATGVAITGNSANLNGGGIANAGTFTGTNLLIDTNSSLAFGGGVANTVDAVSLSITRSALLANTAPASQGADIANFDADATALLLNWWGCASGPVDCADLSGSVSAASWVGAFTFVTSAAERAPPAPR